MEAQVKKSNGLRSGRGFSLSEIEEAGLSVPQARKLGVYVDPRRRTLYEFNVKMLETQIKEHKKKLEEVEEKIEKAEPKRERKIREKKKEEKREKKEKKVKKVKKKKEKEKKVEKKRVKEKGTGLTEIKGVGKKRAAEFKDAGIVTAEDLAEADTEKLAEKTKFSTDYIEKLKKRAKNL